MIGTVTPFICCRLNDECSKYIKEHNLCICPRPLLDSIIKIGVDLEAALSAMINVIILPLRMTFATQLIAVSDKSRAK